MYLCICILLFVCFCELVYLCICFLVHLCNCLSSQKGGRVWLVSCLGGWRYVFKGHRSSLPSYTPTESCFTTLQNSCFHILQDDLNVFLYFCPTYYTLSGLLLKLSLSLFQYFPFWSKCISTFTFRTVAKSVFLSPGTFFLRQNFPNIED